MRAKQFAKVLAQGAMVATVVAAPTAFAAVDMFLKLDGVPGESQDSKHKGDIDVLAWSWGSSSSSTATSRQPGCVSVQDFSFTKYFDVATPKLIANIANGRPVGNAKLVVRKAGERPLEYITIEMNNVVVNSSATGGSGGEDRLTENVTLNFSSANVTYTPQKPDGSAGTPTSAVIATTCKKND
jgi:type VI secretion system secreted protein Hcp